MWGTIGGAAARSPSSQSGGLRLAGGGVVGRGLGLALALRRGRFRQGRFLRTIAAALLIVLAKNVPDVRQFARAIEEKANETALTAPDVATEIGFAAFAPLMLPKIADRHVATARAFGEQPEVGRVLALDIRATERNLEVVTRAAHDGRGSPRD